MIEREKLVKLLNDEDIGVLFGIRNGAVDALKAKLDFFWWKQNSKDVQYVVGHQIVRYKFEDLYRTREDAEFALKYQNITRTETLSLPTFEEFCKYEYVDFRTSKGKHCWLEICLESPTSKFRMAEGSMFTHIWDLTKENYFTACELCRKLFLGEEEEGK